jgi:hypothetical protein
MAFLSYPRPAGGAILALGACACLSRTAFAQPPDASLAVVRTDATSACPDATTLAAAVGRALGRDAFGTKSADAPLKFEVTFTHDSSGYVATIRERGSHTGERTIASGDSSCVELTDALAAAFTVMLDSADREETSPATSAEPSPANPSTAATERPPAPAASSSVLPPKPDGPPARHKRDWYGLQTLLVDINTLVWVLVSAGLAQGQPWTGIALTGDVTFYLAGAPVVHALHGQLDVAVEDAALRAAFAFVGLFGGAGIGAAACTPCDTGFAPLGAAVVGGALGLLVGGAGAMAFDAAVLAYEPHKRRPSSDRTQWTPIAVIGPRGVAAGVGGAF